MSGMRFLCWNPANPAPHARPAKPRALPFTVSYVSHLQPCPAMSTGVPDHRQASWGRQGIPPNPHSRECFTHERVDALATDVPLSRPIPTLGQHQLPTLQNTSPFREPRRRTTSRSCIVHVIAERWSIRGRVAVEDGDGIVTAGHGRWVARPSIPALHRVQCTSCYLYRCTYCSYPTRLTGYLGGGAAMR
jgi:hypothetical protein